MKTSADILTLLEARLERSWAQAIVMEACPEIELEVPIWPHAVSLGKPTAKELEMGFAVFADQVHFWRRWAREHDIPYRETTRRVNGTNQILVTHIEINSVDTAARVVGAQWTQRIARGRSRLSDVIVAFPRAERLPSLLRSAVDMSDLDFSILLAVSIWFRQHQGTYEGHLTPRQVPIEGVHAKWLNKHQGLIRSLLGLEDLALLPAHPPRIHYTYLDPEHLAAGGRKHDSFTVGDIVQLPYKPAVVLISENKDTAIFFPPIQGGIAIEGEGRGASTIAGIDWVKATPHIFYWGDMDQDGLEILNEFRLAGLNALSLLMSVNDYNRYSRLGTNLDTAGNLIRLHPPRPVTELYAGERVLYELFSISPSVLRIEQERIPLSVAHEALTAALTLCCSENLCSREG
jgi:hypothetical protein